MEFTFAGAEVEGLRGRKLPEDGGTAPSAKTLWRPRGGRGGGFGDWVGKFLTSLGAVGLWEVHPFADDRGI